MPGLDLAATGLTLRFGTDLALDIPALTAGPGTLTALAGPSGSGKSSLLYLLSGLVGPTSGAVQWGATDLATLSETNRDRWRRQHAGFVFQNFHLIDELSPLDNVLLPSWFARSSASHLRARATALLDQLAVPHQRPRVALLSRGEQQRVAIARALIGDPAVIFADEPTASLDSVAGEQVTAILHGLAEEGRTVIVASHDAQLLASASRIVRLDHGRLVPRPQGAAEP